MKVKTIIDPTCEEQVVIYARERTELVEKIEGLVSRKPAELVGFQGDVATLLDYNEVTRFTIEQDRVIAHCGTRAYRIKARLYQIEQQAPDCFIRIHQSCLANVRGIARFEAAFSGALRVVFKNGDVDYVSRRNLRAVKERMGL